MRSFQLRCGISVQRQTKCAAATDFGCGDSEFADVLDYADWCDAVLMIDPAPRLSVVRGVDSSPFSC